ncbi:MAG: membrane protein insertase YidC [Rhodocyclaceae bacterium]|nr:membrane protein insertase YidC [Rhodocyclaceae bacterium]
MDNRRLILLLVFSFSLLMLWEAWQKQGQPAPAAGAPAAAAKGAAAVPAAPAATLAPPASPGASVGVPGAVPGAAPPAAGAPTVSVTTDLYKADISAQGGDLVRLELLRHKASGDKTKNFVLFDAAMPHFYQAQSGLTGDGNPNHRTPYALAPGNRELKAGEDKLELRLEAPAANGLKVAKVYTFHRGSYVIDVAHEIENQGTAPVSPYAYFRLVRDGKPAEQPGGFGVATFTGPAVFTEAEKFQKVEFEEISKGKAKYASKADNGWVAIVQHYFVAAWLPRGKVERENLLNDLGSGVFGAAVRLQVPAIEPGQKGSVYVPLYAGPQEQDKLAQVAPGLDLVVDYGWLTVIAAPLFWILQAIHKVVGNWGWSIIGLTVLVKLAFFPLSAASYKSMAKMRVLTPKLMKLKETFADDRQRLNQEMMELYKREKVNPLGGCLPILVQIPVFIALYWVLLGTVEMRGAPWLGWIGDLSVQDPYYVMPLLMGATMLIQTKLNPTPPDPIQAKIMWAMPVVFTGMFLFFPAGLVLYWTVNNLLSIAQQWQITRLIESGQKK